MRTRIFLALLVVCWSLSSFGSTVFYEFEIDTKLVNITGTPVAALAIADQIPAPTIRARVGDTLRVTFHNRLDVATSVHWHGVLLPADQDGVPYLNTRPIPPGGSHTFEFPVLHAGTFWYHSHSGLQIQRGIYGALVFDVENSETLIQEEVVLFSDWTNEKAETVLANLKKDDDYYAFKKDTVQSWDKVIGNGQTAISNRLNRAFTRMLPMDLADVAYDAFLVNGQRENSIVVANVEPEQLKLRMINGSTSSYFDLEYAGGPMTIVAADGQNVEPIRVKRLRISTGETYDVLVPVSSGQAFELRATSVDGSGFSSLYIGDGERVAAPDIPPPNLFLMNLMDMDMSMQESMDMNMEMRMETNRENARNQQLFREESTPGVQQDEERADLVTTHEAQHVDVSIMGDVIDHMTNYEFLIARDSTSLPDNRVWREIPLTLTGNMERYVWSFNGKTTREETQILIRKGENVRFALSNDTMMHHPLHLHGHFFRVVNRHGERSPLKHTVNVPAMGSVVIEFAASEEADWLFHCHNQYHMETGMNRVVSYEETSLFTADTAKLILPSRRWYSRSELLTSSTFVDYEFSVSEARHEFGFEANGDLDDTYETHATYSYHFNRFVSAFAGMETREHHHEANHVKAISGFNLTLPLLIASEWRADDHGEFRLELESELQLTKRLGFGWRWNTDDEYRYGLNYNMSKRWAITVHTDSEYGSGVGIHYLF